MTAVVSSAPGKVLVCGEYAVLEGAPAVAMAVDRRATVHVGPADGDKNTLCAPGYAPGKFRFRYSQEHGFCWDRQHSHALFECVWRHFQPDLEKAVSVTLDTRALCDPETGLKYGLGSSAALTTALVAALAAVSGREPEIEPVAFALHREFQGGTGSGVDIAASCRGGVISFDMAGERTALSWPDGVVYTIFWSGQPADTRHRLHRLAGAKCSPGMRALVQASKAAAASFRDGDQVVHAIREYATVLRQFSDESGLGIYDGGHRAIADIAGDFAVAYKPSGAGGGDVGIAIAEDPQTLSQFVMRAADAGFRRLDIRIDTNGVRQEARVR